MLKVSEEERLNLGWEVAELVEEDGTTRYRSLELDVVVASILEKPLVRCEEAASEVITFCAYVSGSGR